MNRGDSQGNLDERVFGDRFGILETIDVEALFFGPARAGGRIVEAGASRHEAAECFVVSVSSAIRWMQRLSGSGACSEIVIDSAEAHARGAKLIAKTDSGNDSHLSTGDRARSLRSWRRVYSADLGGVRIVALPIAADLCAADMPDEVLSSEGHSRTMHPASLRSRLGGVVARRRAADHRWLCEPIAELVGTFGRSADMGADEVSIR